MGLLEKTGTGRRGDPALLVRPGSAPTPTAAEAE